MTARTRTSLSANGRWILGLSCQMILFFFFKLQLKMFQSRLIAIKTVKKKLYSKQWIISVWIARAIFCYFAFQCKATPSAAAPRCHCLSCVYLFVFFSHALCECQQLWSNLIFTEFYFENDQICNACVYTYWDTDLRTYLDAKLHFSCICKQNLFFQLACAILVAN